MNKYGQNTIKLFYDQATMDRFLGSEQAKYWAQKGHPFKVLSREECKKRLPFINGKRVFIKYKKGLIIVQPLVPLQTESPIFHLDHKTSSFKESLSLSV